MSILWCNRYIVLIFRTEKMYVILQAIKIPSLSFSCIENKNSMSGPRCNNILFLSLLFTHLVEVNVICREIQWITSTASGMLTNAFVTDSWLSDDYGDTSQWITSKWRGCDWEMPIASVAKCYRQILSALYLSLSIFLFHHVSLSPFLTPAAYFE